MSFILSQAEFVDQNQAKGGKSDKKAPEKGSVRCLGSFLISRLHLYHAGFDVGRSMFVFLSFQYTHCFFQHKLGLNVLQAQIVAITG